jgi:hypothetical protein
VHGPTGAAAPQGLEVVTNALISLASKKNAATSEKVSLEQPRVVPPAPFFFSNSISVKAASLAELYESIVSSLQNVGVDFEFNESKWKGHCYIYKPSGFCYFTLHVYTKDGSNTSFVIDINRQKGKHALLKFAYDGILSQLRSSGAVVDDAADVQQVAPSKGLPLERNTSGSSTTSTGSNISLGPLPANIRNSIPASLLSATSELDPELDAAVEEKDDDEKVDQTVASLTSIALKDSANFSSRDQAAISDGFAAIAAMLGSRYDDVAAPAAQSMATLSVSSRVASILGKRALQALVAFATSPQGQASGVTATAAASSSFAAVSSPSVDPALLIFRNLLMAISSHANYSIEARTACVIAVASLAKDASCQEVLNTMAGPAILMDAVAIHVPSAAGAAFRRVCMEAVWTICCYGSNKDAFLHAAKQAGCGARASVLAKPPYAGIDPVFDKFATLLKDSLQ